MRTGDTPVDASDPAVGASPIAGPPGPPDVPGDPPYLRLGRYAWASIGLAVGLVAAGIVLGRLSLVIIPVVLALFPAALLMPVSQWLKRHGLPAAVASILTILGLLAT
ncbi:MAG TPA: hypothetical protein VMM13_10535, partial [Euzebya sp.]|nr:hypothetical protein [Euzebya sp.]